MMATPVEHRYFTFDASSTEPEHLDALLTHPPATRVEVEIVIPLWDDSEEELCRQTVQRAEGVRVRDVVSMLEKKVKQSSITSRTLVPSFIHWEARNVRYV